jgi:hypothetical protein
MALSEPTRKNWSISTRDQRDTYSLALLVTNGTDENVKDRLSEVANGVTEFNFPMNPRTLDLEEPAAVVIRPTQGGGQFIEHQGQIYKNITISGTTGLRPNAKSLQGVTLDPDTGLSPEERTGFDDLIDLRNVFRAYYLAKVDAQLANHVIMVWKNGKEGEYFVVEPISFKTGRDSSSPLTATYTIVLRTIKRYTNFLAEQVKDSHTDRQKDPKKQRSKMNKAIQSLANDISVVNERLDVALTSAENTIRDILTPANELLTSLSDLANTSQRAIQIPRAALHQLSLNLQTAIFEISETIYQPTTIGTNYFNADKADIVSSFRSLKRTVLAVLAETGLWTDGNDNKLNIKKRQYIDAVYGRTDTGGDDLALANQVVGTSTAQAVVGANDNIRKDG